MAEISSTDQNVNQEYISTSQSGQDQNISISLIYIYTHTHTESLKITIISMGVMHFAIKLKPSRCLWALWTYGYLQELVTITMEKKKIQSLPNLRVKGKERHVVFLFLYFKNLIDKYPKPINPNSLNKSKPNVTQIS